MSFFTCSTYGASNMYTEHDWSGLSCHNGYWNESNSRTWLDVEQWGMTAWNVDCQFTSFRNLQLRWFMLAVEQGVLWRPTIFRSSRLNISLSCRFNLHVLVKKAVLVIHLFVEKRHCFIFSLLKPHWPHGTSHGASTSVVYCACTECVVNIFQSFISTIPRSTQVKSLNLLI